MTSPDTHLRPPKKPIYRRWWVWTLAIIAVLIAIAASSASSSAPADPSGTPATVSTAPVNQPPLDDAPLDDKGWLASDIRVQPNPYGMSITARIQNTRNTARTGLFTLTAFRNGLTAFTASGAANTVPAGQTVTVTFVTSDAAPDEGLDGITYQLQSQF